MKNFYTHIIDRLTQLRSVNLAEIRIELKEAIITLRGKIEERMASLDTMDQTSPNLALVLGSLNELLLVLETLVKTAAAIEKLDMAANKARQRVCKRLEKLRLSNTF